MEQDWVKVEDESDHEYDIVTAPASPTTADATIKSSENDDKIVSRKVSENDTKSGVLTQATTLNIPPAESISHEPSPEEKLSQLTIAEPADSSNGNQPDPPAVACVSVADDGPDFYEVGELTEQYGLWRYEDPWVKTPGQVSNASPTSSDRREQSRGMKHALKFLEEFNEVADLKEKQFQGVATPESIKEEGIVEIPELCWRIWERTQENYYQNTKEWADELYNTCENKDEFTFRLYTYEDWLKGELPAQLKTFADDWTDHDTFIRESARDFGSCTLGPRETDKSIIGDDERELYYLFNESGEPLIARKSSNLYKAMH